MSFSPSLLPLSPSPPYCFCICFLPPLPSPYVCPSLNRFGPFLSLFPLLVSYGMLLRHNNQSLSIRLYSSKNHPSALSAATAFSFRCDRMRSQSVSYVEMAVHREVS